MLAVMTTMLTAARAQENKEQTLTEVEVKAARVTLRPDGQTIVPDSRQTAASTNGYTLLGKLALPGIRIDEVMHTITAINNKGAVQLRLNGVPASKDDLLALDPKLVRTIDFIDNPGIRFGDNVAYVIDIHTRRDDTGYALGADLTNSLTAWRGDNMLYAKLNRGNTELGLTYNAAYKDFKGNRYDETADYTLADGTHHTIDRRTQSRRTRNFGHVLSLKYNLADSANYVFQAVLSGSIDHSPGDHATFCVADGTQTYNTLSRHRSHSLSPTLDLYFHHRLGKRQSVTANVVMTHIATTRHTFMNEGGDYAYDVDGNTWSAISELVYENRLRPFTLSAGLRHQLKYVHNTYTGSTEATTPMHDGKFYTFVEVKGRRSTIAYMAGIGLTNERYRQASHRYDHWMWRPKATLSWTIVPALTLRYGIELYQRVSQIAMVSDATLRQNSMEWTVGNPDLRPTSVTKHTLNLSYTRPRLSAQIDMEYRLNRHTNLAHYTRTADNRFLYTQTNQPGCNLLYLWPSLRYELVPGRLSVSANGGVNRFFNYGDDYKHHYTSGTVGGSIAAYLGHWTLTAYADNGWHFLEGEMRGHQRGANYLSCSYRWKDCTVALYWQHPFEHNPRMDFSELLNANLRKQMTIRGTDYGNMLTLNFSWKIGRGSRRHDVEQKLKNEDTQTGIL